MACLMEFWLAPVTEIPVVIAQLAAEARLELVPRAMQRGCAGARLRRTGWSRRSGRDLPERLGPEVPAWRLDPAGAGFCWANCATVNSMARINRDTSNAFVLVDPSRRWSAP